MAAPRPTRGDFSWDGTRIRDQIRKPLYRPLVKNTTKIVVCGKKYSRRCAAADLSLYIKKKPTPDHSKSASSALLECCTGQKFSRVFQLFWLHGSALVLGGLGRRGGRAGVRGPARALRPVPVVHAGRAPALPRAVRARALHSR